MHGADGFANLTRWLACLQAFSPALMLASGIHLVERRGKKRTLTPQRQVQISTLLESIPEAALIVDTARRVIDGNSAALQLLECTREELLGAHAGRFTRTLLHGDGSPPAHPILSRALKGEPVRHERRLVHRAGHRDSRQLVISATPMYDERGGILAALLIARDVTELTALQNRLGDMERHLAIGEMAAALAHDFNNLLAAIGQAAYVLERGGTRSGGERRSYLAVIQNAVRRGSEIIGRIREYQRNGSAVLGPVDLRQVIQESVDLTRPLWSRARVRMKTGLHSVPMVRGNAADLRRVFTNLIINAIEAMPQGGEAEVTCREHPVHVLATVSDTGPGIAPANRSKIFYPYFTTKQKGTGLGLSGAQKIVLSQGGNITFRTEMGKGTTFEIRLPLAQTEGAERGEQRGEEPAA